MQRNVLPNTVDDLIDHLDEMHPEACIALNEPLEVAHRRAGARQVVNYLRALQAKNSNAELEMHKNFTA